MKHMMLDLETMGLAPSCAILSIGAVVFDDEADRVCAELSVRVDLLSCLLAGLNIDAGTLAWWKSQSGAAQAALFEGEAKSIADALGELTDFYLVHECRRVWGNGPVADIAWIEAAYRAVGSAQPWSHRDVRDFRGVRELGDVSSDEVQFKGVQHRAVDDARWQAEVILTALGRLRFWKETALRCAA